MFCVSKSSTISGKLSRPFRELLDFAWSLVDGIILCEVANFLHPGAIKSFNYRPSIQFMCVKNIDNFLNACIKFFGFQTHELFTATELLEVENFEKVKHLLCLNIYIICFKLVKIFVYNGQIPKKSGQLLGEMRSKLHYNIFDLGLIFSRPMPFCAEGTKRHY